MKNFDVETFIDFMVKKKKSDDIQSIDISNWIGCSLRMIQKWGTSHGVKFKRIHGIKHYVWNEDDLIGLGKWVNRERKKTSDYYIPKIKKKKPEKEKPEKKLSFMTIKDIIDEISYNPKSIYVDDKNQGYVERSPDYLKNKMTNTKIRYIQKYCKKNKVPFEYISGRKYYKITQKVKSGIIKEFKSKRLKDIT